MRRPQQQHETPPPRAAIYSRYSTDSQNPRSVADQVRLCQRWLERQGWPPVPPEAVYADEAQSGSTTIKREGYRRLLATIASSDGHPAFDLVLVEDLSRLMRDGLETCHVPDIRTRCNPTYPDPPRWIGVQFTSLSLLPRHRWWSFCR
jgi:DNA invertase Pin-like site-specific DNA recombinase